MSLSIRSATAADLPALARMNKRMIEDERNRNPMTLDQLRDRMRGWLGGGWEIVLFVEDEAELGYALYQHRKDEYYPENAEVYVRHFYVERGCRGRGLGTLAFQTLARTRFPVGCTVVLEVLATNPGGDLFWRRAGFELYCATLKLRLD